MSSEKERCDELIERLYPEVYPLLVRYAYARTHDANISQELANEAFTIACENGDKLLSSPNPAAWLTETLTNILRNYARRRQRWSELFEAVTPDELDRIPASPDTYSLKTMYAGTIPDADLNLIIAVEIEGHTCLEISAKLGISADACYKRLQRAEAAFEKNFKKKEKNCPEIETCVHDIKGGINHVE